MCLGSVSDHVFELSPFVLRGGVLVELQTLKTVPQIQSLADLSVPAFAPLYNTLVRPHLEYTTQACSPNLVVEAECLGQILRLVMRLVKVPAD